MPGAEGKTLSDLQREHYPPPRSAGDPRHGEGAEQSGLRNYVRDLILGFNDGVVSVYALVAGLSGAAFATGNVGIAGVAAATAGALSMGIGEYLSTKSQAEYYAAEARREREHIRSYPQLERNELKEMLLQKGYPPALVEDLVAHVAADEARFVDFMMREEFGVGKESTRSPFAASALIVGAFLVGSSLPVVPFLLDWSVHKGLVAASALSLLGLFAAGAAKARVSGLGWLRGGAEMALLGTVAAAITYGIGHAYHIQA